ncbi:MAG: hypothetical protein IJ054_04765 [Lachnospiraceae bacterium]|nr:hypothetical protein [Lachnospiraceae bacterium]MBQ9233760.1 hypothetical protein [Lachnospiraceae bacterium]
MDDNLNVTTTLKEQSLAILINDLKQAEERANTEGWVDADDLEKELEV